jgi:UDP-GlcNAc:undecaprenyl-phosphate/decaprenyl-phosphate GlcNAc-1-phosphate transferase
MFTYLILFLTALALSLALTPLVGRRAVAWGAVDVPDNRRRIHKKATPRLGGVAIFLAFALTLAVAPFLSTSVGEYLAARWGAVAALVLPAALVFLFGVYDDFREASVPLKLLVQTAAAAALYYCGYGISNLSLPFGGNWELPLYLSFPVTWLWVVGLTNAFNLIDGMDGLAAGASGFAMLSIFLAALAQGNQVVAVLAVVLIGAVIGFLHYNFHPASIFMGDSGSMLLGFMAAALSLAGSNKGTTVVAIAIPLVSFGLPVAEVGLSLARRFIGGHSLFKGDRAHIHHKLLERGLSQRQAVILLYAVCAGFSLFGLLLLNPARSLAAGVFIVLAVGVIFGVRHLKYPEFAELESQLRGGVERRRRRLAVNSRLRQAGAELARARSADEFFAALTSSLAANDFDGLVLKIAAPPAQRHAFARSAQGAGWGAGESFDGQLLWHWARGGQSLQEMSEAENFWQVRLPLVSEGRRFGGVTFYHQLHGSAPAVDLGNLCGSFQRELSGALVRLIAAAEDARHAPAPENASPPKIGTDHALPASH